ncbi:MAG: hypothetical protein ACI9WU_000114 [Myxococcota bacterium]|jgi:hypothetical protein
MSVIDDLVDDEGALEEGEHETSQGTLAVAISGCAECGFEPGDANGVHYGCIEDGNDYWTCVKSGSQCAWVVQVFDSVTNYIGSCGGYLLYPWEPNLLKPEEIVERTCRELGDYKVDCHFPDTSDKTITLCSETDCICPCENGVPKVEACTEFANVITPTDGGFCAKWHRSGDKETPHKMGQKACPPPPGAPICDQIGGGNSTVIPGDIGTFIQNDCQQTLACAKGSVDSSELAACVKNSKEIFDSVPEQTRAAVTELYGKCSHLLACKYTDCIQQIAP